MEENVYSRVLRQLIAKEGSAQAVASLLHVPETTLQRWLHGRARMPLRAFLRALEMVGEQEWNESAERLTFKAGPVVAECVQCGHTEFRRADSAARLTYGSTLACCSCDTEIIHGDLIVRLAKEVARRAGTYVARARARLAKGRRVKTE